MQLFALDAQALCKAELNLRSYELRNGCRGTETTVDVKHSINPTFLIHQGQKKKVIIEWACTKKYSCGK
jgi:hypothetical protein